MARSPVANDLYRHHFRLRETAPIFHNANETTKQTQSLTTRPKRGHHTREVFLALHHSWPVDNDATSKIIILSFIRVRGSQTFAGSSFFNFDFEEFFARWVKLKEIEREIRDVDLGPVPNAGNVRESAADAGKHSDVALSDADARDESGRPAVL